MKSTEVSKEIRAIFDGRWTTAQGRQVPDTERIKLSGNDAVEIDGTVLYSDMADSTRLVDDYKSSFAAEIYKAYLLAACRVIRSESGEITAFDGDRVMAVFVGDYKNSFAVQAALKIHYIVREINLVLKECYPETSYSLSHCTGIDTSKLLVAKTGIRASNDLVWVGRAANYAAKLSALNEPGFPTMITEAVYNVLNDNSKYGGNPRRDMWEKRTWTATGKTIYRSSWWWKF